ncbi:MULTISPECIES: hypothetical protein [unclassified Raoultella]|nr:MULTISPECIES: hypothetical protein [unclassified Raoultella]
MNRAGGQATGVPASRREQPRRSASQNAWAAKWKPFWTIGAIALNDSVV